MFSVTFDEYILTVSETYPSLYESYCQHAAYVDHVEGKRATDHVFFLAIAKGTSRPFFVVAGKQYPGPEGGFHPGVLFVPETRHLFLGVGNQIRLYSWDPPQKIWEEQLWVGFWGWARHGNFVIMSAETELAVWDIFGKKLWSTFVEPPWEYTIQGEMIDVDVMGKKRSWLLAQGPTSS